MFCSFELLIYNIFTLYLIYLLELVIFTGSDYYLYELNETRIIIVIFFYQYQIK
jgi:hypothetical protein